MADPFKPYPCYGEQFSPQDKECQECDVQNSCRNLFLSRRTVTPPVPVPPQLQAQYPQSRPPQPPPPPPVVPVPPQAVTQYRPAPPPAPPPPPQVPVYQRQPQPPQLTPQQQYEQAYRQWYQQYMQQPLPTSVTVNPADYFQSVPQPMAPQSLAMDFYRGPSDWRRIFGQFDGEQTMTRLGKNLLLRGAEATATELVRFFRHWPWPPTSDM